MQSSVHCFNSLLPAKKKTYYKRTNRHCNYTLPQCNFDVLSIHLSIGVFLHCNFLCVTVIALSYFYCIIFMHVCGVSFNQDSVSVQYVCVYNTSSKIALRTASTMRRKSGSMARNSM